MKQYYRYVHILYHYDTLFNSRIVQMINDINNGFNVDEHLFVTPHLQTYEVIKECPNVVLHREAFKEKSLPKHKQVKVLLDYINKCDWIIMHSLCRWTQTLLIKKKYRHKIIWRTWGHDLWPRPKPDSFVNAIKWLIYPQFVKIVSEFKTIGVANIVDELCVKEKYGNILTMQLPYPNPTQKTVEANQEASLTSEYKILIGHSADPVDRHLSIAHMLEKWKDKNIKVFCPIAYGDNNYGDMIKRKLIPIWGDKITFITRIMDYESYQHFMNNMDVIILAGKHSYALGNIELAVLHKKKIFLSRDGILCRALEHDNLPYGIIEDINDIKFSDFVAPVCYPQIMKTTLLPLSYADSVNQWYKFFEWLNSLYAI